MKRKPGEKNDHLRHRIFQERTGNIFRSQKVLAAKFNMEICYTLEEFRKKVIDAFIAPCPYCLERLTVRNFSLDHKTPIARNGSFEKQNLQVICLGCNQVKGKMTAEEFGELIIMLRRWHADGSTDVRRRLRAGGRALASMFWKAKRSASNGTHDCRTAQRRGEGGQ